MSSVNSLGSPPADGVLSLSHHRPCHPASFTYFILRVPPKVWVFILLSPEEKVKAKIHIKYNPSPFFLSRFLPYFILFIILEKKRDHFSALAAAVPPKEESFHETDHCLYPWTDDQKRLSRGTRLLSAGNKDGFHPPPSPQKTGISSSRSLMRESWLAPWPFTAWNRGLLECDAFTRPECAAAAPFPGS